MRGYKISVFGLGMILGLLGCGETFVAADGAGASGGGGAGAGASGGGGAGAGAGAAGAGASGGSTSSGSGECARNETNDCYKCLSEQCATAYCQCEAVPDNDCLELVDCYDKIADNPPKVSALQYCWQTHPPSISAAGALLVCGADKCNDKCSLPEFSACAACQFDSCAKAVNACLGKSECTSFLTCYAGCMGDMLCQNNCAKNTVGFELAKPLGECTAESCSPPCSQMM